MAEMFHKNSWHFRNAQLVLNRLNDVRRQRAG